MDLEATRPRPAAFLLFRANRDAVALANSLREESAILWSSAAYGPYPVLAYAEMDSAAALAEFVESLRCRQGVLELDARVCKPIPGDEDLPPCLPPSRQGALLLINVDYRKEKERVVTVNLRRLDGLVWVRAMWGPTDIIAIVEADEEESMRNLICDEVKISKGVATNTTLYCYPNGFTEPGSP